MTDLTPNHPAVEAASMAPYEGREWMADLERMHGGQSFREAGKPSLAAALTAALPHLTADDLRHTPPGWQLMAVGYKAALAQIDALADFYEEDGDTNMAENMRDVRRRMARRRPYLEADA